MPRMNQELKPRSTAWIWLALAGLVAAVAAYIFLVAPWLEERGQRKRVEASIPEVAEAMGQLEQCVFGGEVPPREWSAALLARMYTTPKFFAHTIACHDEFRARTAASAKAFAESGNDTAKTLAGMLKAVVFSDTGEAWGLPILSLDILCDGLHEQHNLLADLADFAGRSGVARINADCSYKRPELGSHKVALPELPRDAHAIGRRAWITGDTFYSLNDYDRVSANGDSRDRWVDVASTRGGSEWNHEVVRHAWTLTRGGEGIWGVGQLPKETKPRLLRWDPRVKKLEPGIVLPASDYPPRALRAPGGVHTFVSTSLKYRYTAVRIPNNGRGRPSATEFARKRRGDGSWRFYVADNGTVGALGVVARDADAVFEIARSPASGKATSDEKLFAGLPAELRACSTGARQWAVVGHVAVLTTTDGGATWTEVHRFDPLLHGELAMCRGDTLVLVGKRPGGVAHRESVCRPEGCTGPTPLTRIESKWVAVSWTEDALAFLVGFERHDLGAVLLRDDDVTGTPQAASYFRRGINEHRSGHPGYYGVWRIDDAWFMARPDDGLHWQ